jgi:hypothetical protein
MKARIGTDRDSKLVHTVVVTARQCFRHRQNR